MKVLDKNLIIKKKMVKHVIDERNLMSSLDYPLVVNIRFSLQDEFDLFLIVDFMQGGDLRYCMNNLNFSQEQIMLYSAQTALAVNYLHSMGFIHRDIKPDNILLDSEGHAHLSDFNLSIKIEDAKNHGIGGTTGYIAPEMLKNEKYDIKVDWWSLGVMIYEWTMNKLPYDEKTTKIIKKEPKFSSSIDINLKDLINGLLNKSPKNRYGWDEIKNHPWYSNINWNDLEKKITKVAFVPDQKHVNSDSTFILDEQFLEKKKRIPLDPELQREFELWDWKPAPDSKIREFPRNTLKM